MKRAVTFDLDVISIDKLNGFMDDCIRASIVLWYYFISKRVWVNHLIRFSNICAFPSFQTYTRAF